MTHTAVSTPPAAAPPEAAPATPTPAPSATGGLSSQDAAARLARDGPNELLVSRPRTAWARIRAVVLEPMFLLLAACGGLYMLLGNVREAAMLLGFVCVVVGISLFQERRSERSLDALRDLASPQARVQRDGTFKSIDARELVVGDRVLLAEGDRVPADLRLVESANLALDEAMLTGESLPVDKQAAASDASDATAGGASASAGMAYAATLVTRGSGLGIVTATGARSALGRIGQSLAAITAPPTPLQRETGRIVKSVAAVGLALGVLLAIFNGVLLGRWLDGLLAGITLAMAVLPEELPVVLTLFLGLGAWRLAREHVLTRSIPAIERLGATTVLCVDKTGTLTANRMTLRRLWCADAAYDTTTAGDAALAGELHGLLEYAVLASHRRAFDPMEVAIVAAGQRLLRQTEHLHADWILVEDYPLSPGLLAMSRVWRAPDDQARLVAAKGAPEAIVDLCHLDAAAGARVATQVRTMAAEGLRVLGVARATAGAALLPPLQHDFQFEFLGLLGLEDPVRPDVPAAIAQCRAAGIRVVMITGDHAATAVAIGRQAGLDASAPAISGTELEAMSDAVLRERLAAARIFCRVQPEQKLRLVRALQARGEVVAMTGDGVNDAPALKAADIGVAMGARGTEVAREAAALVLLDDDFASLVTAVKYGRRVFANLRKAMVFVIGVHVPIVGLSLLPVLLGWPMVLMPAHVMFLQLIIDPACSVVFEAQPLEADAMCKPPRRVDQRLFDAAVLARGLWQGVGLLALLLATYAGARWLAPVAAQREALARTLTFVVLVLSNLALIHTNQAWGATAWRNAGAAARPGLAIAAGTIAMLALVLAVPAVSVLFAFVTPPPQLLLAAIGVAATALLWFEGVKRVLRRPP